MQGDIRRVIEAMKNGFAGPDLKVEWDTLQERKTALQAKLDSADEPPPLLHPGMAELSRQTVTDRARALEHPDTRIEAAESIRGLIDAIVLTPPQAPWKRTSFAAVGELKPTPEGQEIGLH